MSLVHVSQVTNSSHDRLLHGENDFMTTISDTHELYGYILTIHLKRRRPPVSLQYSARKILKVD